MMSGTNLDRQQAIFDTTRFAPRIVDVIGGGGVGGFIAVDLFVQGVQTRLFDPKTVASHNPPNQIHGERHIGMNKTASVADIAHFLTGKELAVHPIHVDEHYVPADVVNLCVDSMGDRRIIMERIFSLDKKPALVIDTRIDTNYIVVHTIIPSNTKHQDKYWQYWFPDAEAVNDGGCSDKRALRAAAMCAASVAGSQLVQWFGNGERDLSTAPDNQIRITMRPWSSKTAQW